MKKDHVLIVILTVILFLSAVNLITLRNHKSYNRLAFDNNGSELVKSDIKKVPSNYVGYYYTSGESVDKNGKTVSLNYKVLKITGYFLDKAENSHYYKLGKDYYIDSRNLSKYYLFKSKSEAEFKAPLLKKQDRYNDKIHDRQDTLVFIMIFTIVTLFSTFYNHDRRINKKYDIN